MPTPLEALTHHLFDACDERLGDSITVTPPAAAAIPCVAHIDYGEEAQVRGISAVVVQQIVIDIAKAILPGEPGKGWRVSLPRVPGKIFEPKGVADDPQGAGLRWRFGVAETPHA